MTECLITVFGVVTISPLNKVLVNNRIKDYHKYYLLSVLCSLVDPTKWQDHISDTDCLNGICFEH